MRRCCGVLLLVLAGGCRMGDADARAENEMSADTVVAERLVVIGEEGGLPEYLFGDVTSVAVGPGEIVYVADRIGSTVRAYQTNGAFLTTVGSEGQGPGEFEWPNDITFDPVGRMYVRDAYRITVFGSTEPGGVADSLIRTIPLGGYANLSSTRARTDGRLYYYPGYLFRDGEPDRYFYQVFDSIGPNGDTIAVPPLPNLEFLRSAVYRISARSGRMVEGVNRAPFEPIASWDISASGTVFTSRGDRYEVVKWTAAGDTADVIRFTFAARSVPESERQDSARVFRSRLDSLPVPVDRVLGMSEAARNGVLPPVLPEILALQVVQDGSIWLRRWPVASDRTVFDVIDSSGTERRHVTIGADLLTEPPPFVSAEFIVGVVQDPLTDIQRVVVFRTRAPVMARP